VFNNYENESVQIFGLIVFCIWVIFWLYWFISAWWTRSPVKRQQSSFPRFLFFIVVVMVFWMLFFDQFAVGFLLSRIVPDGMAVGLVGILITLAGLGFAVWARIHLGKYWSYMPEIKVNHKLIRTGPYQLVRHPIYTGILFAFAGTAIVIGEVWALFAILMMLAAFLGKIWWEEKVLLEEFGEEYVRYKEEVKALIPFVV